MEPVTLIVTALAAGAAAGGQNAASEAVKDAYTGFKQLLLRRFGDRRVAQAALTEVEDQAGTEGLDNVGIDEQEDLGREVQRINPEADAELTGLATRLLTLLGESKPGLGAPSIDLSRAKGVQVGSNNSQTNSF